MSDPTQGEYRELIDAMKEMIPLLSRVADRDSAPLHFPPPGNVATIAVNAGGVGVAVAVGCAAFALACLMFAMLLQFDMGRKIERAQDYQNMLWQRYPELRPENLKPKEDKKP
jgi:hypothetical protein